MSGVIRLAPQARAGLVVGGAVLSGLALAVPGVRSWLPERACQLPGALLRSRPIQRAALAWGFDLGLATRTFMVTPATYAFLALASAQHTPLASVALCTLYGFVRALTISAFSLAEQHRGETTATIEVGWLQDMLRAPLFVSLGTAAVLWVA